MWFVANAFYSIQECFNCDIYCLVLTYNNLCALII